MLVIEPVHWIN